MRRRILQVPRYLSVCLGAGIVLSVCFPIAARGQDELRAYRQVAFESGHGTLSLSKGPDGTYYALNRADRCVWMFSSSGSRTGRISSVGMGPSDLLSPKDLTVDGKGNAIVADGSDAIKVFSPNAQLLLSFPFKRPEHVGVLSDGRILVSGFPKDNLISVFDPQGRFLAGIGTPAKIDDKPFFNAVLNMGAITVDSSDNIYYSFKYALTPTIRKYSPDGTLLAEWHLKDGELLNQILAAARMKYEENKKSGSYGGVPILTAATFDESSKTLWLASGAQVTQLDGSGNVIRMVKLVRPDGRPVSADGIAVDGAVIRASTYLAGTFEFQKPQ